MKLRIAILGTRGIPNHYGGFEQISGYLAQGLAARGHDITVYNSHRHPYQSSEWNGVNIIHCFDPEHRLGTAGQFIYDLNCILDARSRAYDVILLMGYTSSSIWGSLYPRNTVILSNMDGLEWKRSKYAPPVKKFLEFAEKLAVKYSDACIADSLGIQAYLEKKYRISAVYIPYGAEIIPSASEDICEEYGIIKNQYMLLIARMEPENNIDLILSAFSKSRSSQSFVVVGNTSNKYGRYLRSKYRLDGRIVFTGGIFDNQQLHSLRFFATLYFHGHSVGGTNPSLLEAMASQTYIAAHDNAFNKHILEKDACYFTSEADITRIIEQGHPADTKQRAISNNFQKIVTSHSWSGIVEKYEKFILSNCKVPALEENVLHTGYVSE